jgi:hypothetical protein
MQTKDKRYNCSIPELEVEQGREFFSFEELLGKIKELRTTVTNLRTSRKAVLPHKNCQLLYLKTK